LLTSYAAPPDVAVELQLRGVLDAAAARGYPIKVVLFADENDTGGELEPLEDPQVYAATVSGQLGEVSPLRAPVLIVTPDRYGVAGKQPRGETLSPITPPLAAELARDLTLPEQADGTALARAAMAAVRRLAADAGRALPERIPPAKNNPRGILGNARQETIGGSWLIAAVVAASALLIALLVVLYRGSLRASAARET
jgi:hypothetical protein